MKRAFGAIAVAAGLLCACSSGSGSAQTRKAATSTVPTTAAPSTTGVVPSTPPADSATPTTHVGEIRGTATDFCGALTELGERSHEGGTFDDARVVIQESAADWIEVAPANLKAAVDSVTQDLFGVAENLGLGVITSNDLLSSEMQRVLTSPDAQTVAAYGQANCTP